nr:hypothetical protein [Escherichia coli]QUN01843.1 hypothetical protein [Escherichia coli]
MERFQTRVLFQMNVKAFVDDAPPPGESAIISQGTIRLFGDNPVPRR